MNETKQPNVILCVCDQLRSFEVGCYGNDIVNTPNMDKLAKQGVRIATACSNNPVCTPARSIMMTGQYSRTCNGQTGNTWVHPEDETERKQLRGETIAEAFKKAGYGTQLIGKWHMQPSPGQVGFDHYVYPATHHRHRDRVYYESSKSGSFVVEDWTWDYDMKRLQQFIAQRDEQADEPYFLYFNIEPPHMPLVDAPELYTNKYDKEEVPLRPNVFDSEGKASYDAEWFKIYRWDYLYYKEHLPHTEELPEDYDLKQLTAHYYGLVDLVDDQLGKVMDLVANQKTDRETILLFTSDHGDLLGSHLLYNKDRLYEEAIRVPMIFHAPTLLDSHVVEEQIVSLVDVMPTLLSLANVEIPQSAQGQDCSSVISGQKATLEKNWAIIETNKPEIGIRTQTHLLGLGLKEAVVEEKSASDIAIDYEAALFYQVEEDPYQLKNLAGQMEQDATALKMKEQLEHWHRTTQ